MTNETEMAPPSASSDLENSITKSEVEHPEHIEIIRTISRVENAHYHEKDGLRTEGDGVDHEHYNSVSEVNLDGAT